MGEDVGKKEKRETRDSGNGEEYYSQEGAGHSSQREGGMAGGR